MPLSRNQANDGRIGSDGPVRPFLLDLFCGAGGASRGYHQAGFYVVGVDNKPQPRYPYRFILGDALDPELIETLKPAAIHASPTCQSNAVVTAWRGRNRDHPDTLTPTLEMLRGMAIPYVVENVPEAPVRADLSLCGTQFGLMVRRHRDFETNWPVKKPKPCQCDYDTSYLIPFNHTNERAFADAMECTWMSYRSARQAIPPAYTRFIGTQLRKILHEQEHQGHAQGSQAPGAHGGPVSEPGLERGAGGC